MATGTILNPKTKDDDKRTDEGQNKAYRQNENKDPGQNPEPFEKAKEAGVQAMDKAKEAVVSVGEMASQAVNAVGKKADELTASAGTDIKKFGDNLREKAPHDGLIGHASQAMADTIKGSGSYLEEAKLSGMADDVTRLVEKHPLPAMLLCLGVGFMLGRAFKE